MPDKKQTLREKLEIYWPLLAPVSRNDMNRIIQLIVEHVDDLDREAVRVERITPQPAPLTDEERASLEEDNET